MNPPIFRRSLFALLLVCTTTVHAAGPYYWDNNDVTAGFGTATGTWGTDTLWSTSNTGVLAPTVISPTTSDAVNFGTATAGNGLGAGTITLNGTVNASTLTFGTQSGAIVLSGGTALNLAATSTITVNNAAGATIDSAITGAGTGLTKAGTGTLNLGSSLTKTSFYITGGKVVMGSGCSLTVGSAGTGAMDVTGGQLDLSATTYTFNVATVMFGHNSGTATITLGGSSTITASTGFGVGMGGNFAGAAQNNGTGTVNISADSVTTINTPIFQVGMEKANNGTLKMLGAGNFTLEGISGARTTAYVGSRIDAAVNVSNTQGSVDLVSGKAILHLAKLYVGCNTGNATAAHPTTGTMKLGDNSENHLDISGTGNVVQIGGAFNRGTPTGTVTIANLDAASSITSSTDGSSVILIANRPNGADTAIGTLNLNGGTLTITTTGASTAAIAGGGGTSALVLGNATGLGSGMKLIAGASSTAWIKDLTSAKIKTTGVTFDTNSYDITIPQALLTDGTDTGGGLTKASAGTLTLSGVNTYTGTTTISGGTLEIGGAGQLNSGSYAGDIANSGELKYNSSATQILSGAISGTGTLTKSGTSTLTLSGANTYTGDTTVSDGTLALADNAGLKFAVTDTTSNKVTGSGTATFDGDFTIDISAVSSGLRIGSWTLVDTTTKSFTANFTLAGWSETSGVWSYIDLSSRRWSFSESTGILTLGDGSPFSIWAADLGLPAGQDGPGDDPDGDGYNNLTEYGFGGDPLSGSDNAKVFSQFKEREIPPTNGTELVLTVAVLADTSETFVADGNSMIGTSTAGGITYRIEGSNDLNFSNVQVGQVAAEPTTAMNNVLPAGYVYRSFVLAPGGTPAKGFLRAVVEKP